MTCMKRILAVVLLVSLLGGLLSGCGGNGQTGKTAASAEPGVSGGGTETEEPYEVNFMYFVAKEGSNQAQVEAAVSELARKELNMTVKLIPVTFGTYYSQAPMMLAANETLDLLPVTSENFSTYIESQYILNSADYADYAGDIVEVLGGDAYTAYIGDFLVGYGQMKERAYPAGLVVRKDILDELGYTVGDFSVTTDDYSSFAQITELFAAVKEKYPGMICFDGTTIMARQNLSYMDNLGSDFGVLENYGQTNTVTNWFESEQYRQFCSIARDWFEKGYTSQDIAVNQDAGTIKMKAGNCFSFVYNTKPNTGVEVKSMTGYDVEIIMLGSAMKFTNAINSAVYSLANASKDPQKAMEFLNWTYTSREFHDLINWGIEGVDWVEDENGQAAYPEGIDANNVSYHNDFGFMYPNQFIGHAWAGNPLDIWDQYRAYNDSLLVSNAFGFTFDSTPVATEEAQLNAVLEQYRNDLAFGAVDIEAGIEAFNKALYDAGLQTVMDEKQKQLDGWLASREQ